MSKEWTKADWQRHQERVIHEEYRENLREKGLMVKNVAEKKDTEGTRKVGA